MLGLSIFLFPLFAGLVWLGMLLGMLLWWVVKGSPHLQSFNSGQTIAYISDVGATELKPLFIAMSAVTVVVLDLTFIFERYLRHTGRLTHNTSRWQKILSILAIIASIAGAAGIILLSIFDTLHHPNLHDAFLVLFLAGYIVSAIFICWEYQRLGMHYRQHRILRISFWMKLAFILVEVAAAIAFGVCNTQGKYNAAAIIEWIIALIFTFYVLSFAVDFLPALRSKNHRHDSGETAIGMAEREAGMGQNVDGPPAAGRYYGNPPATDYSNGYPNGANGGYKPPQSQQPIAQSRNF